MFSKKQRNKNLLYKVKVERYSSCQSISFADLHCADK